MGRKCLDKNKRGNKYIRLLNEDNWLIVERLEKLPKYVFGQMQVNSLQ